MSTIESDFFTSLERESKQAHPMFEIALFNVLSHYNKTGIMDNLKHNYKFSQDWLGNGSTIIVKCIRPLAESQQHNTSSTLTSLPLALINFKVDEGGN